jgi:hypothetical protein
VGAGLSVLLGGEGNGGFYGCWVFKRVSEILLGKIVCLSLRWFLAAYSACVCGIVQWCSCVRLFCGIVVFA